MEMNETSDEGNRASSEFRDNGVCLGKFGEMTSQSDLNCVGQFKEGSGRVGQDAMA